MEALPGSSIHTQQPIVLTRPWDSNGLHVNSLSQVVYSIYNIDVSIGLARKLGQQPI